MSDSESWQASTMLTSQPFLVASRHEANTKHGATFVNVQLKAKGGREITGRIWDRHRDLFECFQPGRVLDVSGKLEEYQGRLSLIVEGAEPSTIPVAEILRQTHLDTNETWRKLQVLVNGMNEPLTRFVSQRLMARSGFEAAFKRAPAASKMHNN